MKDVTCQSVCRQIDESDLQWVPDAIVSQHLRGCAACKKFFDEHATLRKFVGSLGNVQAPADFDFQLRSRLANERSQGSGGFVFRGWAVGFGPVAFASLLIIAGVIVFGVSRMQSHRQQMAPEVSQGSNLNTQTAKNSPSTERQGKEVTSPDDSQKAVADSSPRVDRFRNVPNALRKSNSRSQIVSKDMGSIAAPVVKQDEQVANAGLVFPIEGSSQSLIMSLDQGNGVSRTISVPRVSFGSQRVLTGEQGPILKTSAKGVW